MIKYLKSDDTLPGAEYDLLAILGRMGVRANSAKDVLLNKLRRVGKNKAPIRVVLANIGYKSKKNVAEILRELKEPHSCIKV